MTKKKQQKTKKAVILLGWKGDELPWNGSHQQKSNEYFFSLKINGKFIIQTHYGMPYTRGRDNYEFIRQSYEEMIEEETTSFARELKCITEYQVVNGDRWDFFNQNKDHEEGGKMSDDAKNDFLNNLEAKLKGRKRINRKLLTYDYENYRDSSMDGAPP